MAGFTKRNWGTQPGGQTPQAGGQTPQASNPTPQTGSPTPQAGGQQPFAKRQWGTKPSGSGQQSQFRSDLWNLNVKFAKYTQNGSLAFKLSGFKWEDEARMNKIAPDVFFIKKSEKTGAEGLIVKADKVEDFRNLLPTITNELRACNHYTDTSVNDFAEKIENTIEKTPTQAEISANTASIISNWKQLLQSLNDPETKKRFLAFQTTYTCQNSFSDAVLSPKNVIEVQMADPQASFVTDAATWRKRFNRVVVPGAKFIIVTKPEQTIPPENLLNADPIVMRNGGWKALCKKSGGPWYGEAWSAIKRVRINNRLKTTYYDAKVYDVRFTKPIDPNDDPFLQVANLINNLTGELNMVAQEIMKKDAILRGEAAPDFDAKKEGIQTSEDLLKYKSFILKKCKADKIQVQEIGSDEDIIANAIYAYAYKIAESYNVLSPQGRAAFASAVLYSVANAINLNSTKVSQAVRIFDKLSPDESEELAQKTFDVFKELAGVAVGALNESGEIINEGLMSFEEYREMIRSLFPNRDNVKRQFDAINERLNNVEF